MNFIFISPQFPNHYWNFCDRLKKNGVNVLGIGDTPFNELHDELKNSLTEYYFVTDLKDYDAAFKAVAFLSFKYGKIDWIESNNEFWLELDSRLRTDFHITTGEQFENIKRIKNKSEMKKYYALAKVPTARLHKITSIDSAQHFIDKVGYPVIVKPDVGVGANDTYKLSNDEELKEFFDEHIEVPYVMEEFVTGDTHSYDAIIDSNSNPLFESTSVWDSALSMLVDQAEVSIYTEDKVPEKLLELGRATVKAFGVKSRFVHLEFFKLTKARKGLGEVGDFVGLEVNMRPAGGYITEMMNVANFTDVYQIWADMVTYNERKLQDSGQRCYCAFASRRDANKYLHTHEEILARYGDRITMCDRMPELMGPSMGNQMYIVKAADKAAVDEFVNFVHEKF